MSPRRLHRTIPGHSDLFTLASTPYDFYDDEITHITIHRGPGERGGGWTASVLEFGTPLALAPTLAGYNVAAYLRAAPAEQLAAATYTTRAAIERRFTGRLATQAVEDRGDRRRPVTTVRAASWLAQMTDSARTTTPTAGRTIKRTLEDALGITPGTPPRGVYLDSYGVTDRIYATEPDPMSWSDVVSKYVEEPGYLLREGRDGRTGLMSLPYLATYATAKANQQVPLTRSEAISPAAWTMHAGRPAADQTYSYRRPADGALMESTASLPSNTGELAATQRIDWSNLYRDTTQMESEAYGRAYSSHVRFYRIPSITIDLLHLIGSPREYDRRQAGQLLALEVFDPVALSGDWPWQVRGIHHAAGITETITPERWDMELSLVPHAQMVGATSPETRRLIWDQMTSPWDDHAPAWNAYPATL